MKKADVLDLIKYHLRTKKLNFEIKQSQLLVVSIKQVIRNLHNIL